jgi:KaiC/GvpD/RAD55 family RecA-like ATPase
MILRESNNSTQTTFSVATADNHSHLSLPDKMTCENAVLAGLLLGSIALTDLMERKIESEAFTVPQNAKIYEIALELHNQGQPINFNTVAVAAADKNIFGSLSSTKFIGGLLTVTDGLHPLQMEHILDWFTRNYHTSPTYRLKLELNAYLAESDPMKRILQRRHIQTQFGLSTGDFNEILQAQEQQQQQPEKHCYTLEEFLELEFEAQRWLFPGILPQREAALLAAKPKMGKTLLAMDMLFSVATGDNFLGEPVGVTGNVLYVGSDESKYTLKKRLRQRGFDIRHDRAKVEIMTYLDIAHLKPLEERLEALRPKLTVIDSLTSISQKLSVSENSPEIARFVYRLKELCERYGSALVLIHHENKDREAKGIDKVSGSGRLPAAVNTIIQLDTGDAKGSFRYLKTTSRETEGITLKLEINPYDEWSAQGIYKNHGETDDPDGHKRTIGNAVIQLLKAQEGAGLEVREIRERLGLNREVYTILNRLTQKGQVGARRSTTRANGWVYYVDTIDNELSHDCHNPPPSPISDSQTVELHTQSIDIQATQKVQQKVNNSSENFNTPTVDKPVLNLSNQDETMVSPEVQQLSPEGGGGGGQQSPNNSTIENDPSNLEQYRDFPQMRHHTTGDLKKCQSKAERIKRLLLACRSEQDFSDVWVIHHPEQVDWVYNRLTSSELERIESALKVSQQKLF